MTTRSWLDSEPGARETVGQALRAASLGLKRPAATIGISVFLLMVLVCVRATSSRVYTSSVVLQVSEMDGAEGGTSRSSEALADDVRDGIWTDVALLAIVARFNLYPARSRESRAALEAFRGDLAADVQRNDFAVERSVGEPARSARIVVRFRSTNSAEATNVARALAELVVTRELESLTEQTGRAAARATEDLVHGRAAEHALALAIADAQRREGSSPTPRLQVELVTMLGSHEALVRRVAALERRETLASFAAAVARRRVGLRFRVVDDGVVPRSRRRDFGPLATTAVLAFILGAPLVTLGVGATRMPRGVA